MPKERSILLIEDNLAIARQVVDFLEGLGWNVDFASSGQLGIKLALNAQFNVILLDLNLPDIDGLAVCQAIKEQAQRNQPILMVTARDAFEDKAKGFGHGADDYLTKPYDLRELALRCEALSRRPELHRDSLLIEGGLRVDMRAMTAHWQQTLIPLTGIGLKLLSELLVAHPYPVSRSDLISAIWSTDPPESNALKSHIYSLRKVLEHVSGRQLLFTISNVGYQLKGLD